MAGPCSCGSRNPHFAKFCSQCGAKIEGGGAGEKRAASSEGGRKGGDKRPKTDMPNGGGDAKPAVEQTAMNAMFSGFAKYLDDRNDRRERLIKCSRDVTADSKKVIFFLHRMKAGDAEASQKAFEQADEMLLKIKKGKLLQIAEDLPSSEDFWKFHHAISPGVQEYLEAVSFRFYLEHLRLISYNEAKASLLPADSVDNLELCYKDYMLAVADLTGELMRYGINSVRHHETVEAVTAFVSKVYQQMAALQIRHKEYSKKLEVMSQSLAKLENLSYGIKLRGSEYPPEMVAEMMNKQEPERAE